MRLNVHEWGDPTAPAVVCIHGLTGFGGRYRRVAEEYLESKRVIAVDLRGHGRSGWDPPWDLDTHVADLLETADALGVGRAAWVGHSIGGRLVAELAAVAPSRVDRAVLLDPAMQIAADIALERAELLRPDTSFATADDAVDTRLADPALFTTQRSTIAVEVADHLALGDDGRYRWRFCPTMAIVAWSEMATAPPPWPSCPTLVIVGARSWIPVDVPSLPHLATMTVPGGHSVLWDDFEATAEAIAGFLG